MSDVGKSSASAADDAGAERPDASHAERPERESREDDSKVLHAARDAGSSAAARDSAAEGAPESRQNTSASSSSADSLDAEEIAAQLAALGLTGPPEREPLLESFDLEGVASYIAAGKAKNIVVMVGAGISVAAGIPDFRSPGTGLYDNLQKYDLPRPTAVFEIDYFRKHPQPFYMLAKELFPGQYKPTATHYFIRLLHERGLLRRCFTQNIDSLEVEAGLPKEKLVAAHGNFDSAACIDCRKSYATEEVRKYVEEQRPMHCSECEGLVKPCIVFFGEDLPRRFFQLAQQDMPACDLLIVMGTSLVVHPFASLIGHANIDTCPRLLINREKAAELSVVQHAAGVKGGFWWGDRNHRDALFLGDCDEGVRRLCACLGEDWVAELEELQA
ncbi:unnamed protein product [Pedinophyceae sp. YPF-701]|nr:unnamed protein product [Pedinophyceae sp. YPF-701]